MQDVDDWESDLLSRYPDPEVSKKTKEEFRNYIDSEREAGVREFYRLNHKFQTYEFVTEKEKDFLKFDHAGDVAMGCRRFSKYPVDDSYPDIELHQVATSFTKLRGY